MRAEKLLGRVSLFLFILFLVIGMPLTSFSAPEDGPDEMVQDATGTDPRDFGSKFMPYYRFMELDNNVEIQTFTMFGMYAFNPRFAMTYEWPLAMEIDYSDVDAFKNQTGGILDPVGPDPGAGGGVPISSLDLNGDEVGMGDLNLRFFLRPRAWEWHFMGGEKQHSLIPVVETTMPTATDELLGNETWVLSPGFVYVTDMPFKNPPFGLGFLALMNFYDFDVAKESGRQDVSQYRGRWFWMQPLTMPAFAKDPADTSFHIFDSSGLFLLTEFQPVYDFEESHFSLWVGPELGKILREGSIFYAKPGFGIDPSEGGDREWTLEIGFRYFL